MDSASTATTIKNKAFLLNSRDCTEEEELLIHTNGGDKVFQNQGNLNIIPMIAHFDPTSLANFLALKDVSKTPGVRVTMDTDEEAAMLVHLPNQNILNLRECGDGLYCYNIGTEVGTNKSKNPFTNYSPQFVTTVKTNKDVFIKKDIQRADKARLLQEYIGWPSTEAFKSYINKRLILNCDTTTNDIDRSIHIYGALRPFLQEKMTSNGTLSTTIHVKIPLPHQIAKTYSKVQLYIYFFYVNKVPFLHTKSGHVNFLTVQQCISRGKKEIMKGLEIVKKIYRSRGFRIVCFHGDNEFNIYLLKRRMMPAEVNKCAKDEHIPMIEISI